MMAVDKGSTYTVLLVFLGLQLALGHRPRAIENQPTQRMPSDNNVHVLSGPRKDVPFHKVAKPKHCQDLWDSGLREPGVFYIYPNGIDATKVWCEHGPYDTATVFQRRQFGNVSFFKPWQDYKTGFGDPRRDYWMGLDALFHLTYQGNMKLVIALQDWLGQLYYVTYTTFRVADESQRYHLTIGHPSSQIGDDMSFSSNMPFATYDRPDSRSCVHNQHAGWWYNYCAYALLNGKYYRGGHYNPPGGFYDGIYWKDWHGYDYSMKYVSMAVMIK